MRRREALQGVRMAMFLNVLSRWESAELNQAEAAELLGVSERTFRRWTRRYEEDGEVGLLDGRLGKASGKRVPVDRAQEVERLYRERLPLFYGQAFPRASGEGPRLWVGLHLDEAASAMGGRCCEGAAQGGASPKAGTAAGAGHDAASGRLAPRMARRRGAARSDRHDGRRDRGDLFGVSHRGGRHGLDLPGAERGLFGARPADEPLYGPGQPLFPHHQGRRDRPRLSDPGRSGAGAIGRRAHRRFLAA